MSTLPITESESFPTDVIVRAFAGEPVHLKAKGYQAQNVIEIVGADGDKTMGFPADDVYRFDASLFRRLRTAYEQGQSEKLAMAWKSASRMNS